VASAGILSVIGGKFCLPHEFLVTRFSIFIVDWKKILSPMTETIPAEVTQHEKKKTARKVDLIYNKPTTLVI
jgi:hypothetical protein